MIDTDFHTTRTKIDPRRTVKPTVPPTRQAAEAMAEVLLLWASLFSAFITGRMMFS